MNKYIFFEIIDYSLMRFPKWVSLAIEKVDNNAAFIFVYMYKYKKSTADLSWLPENATVINLYGNVTNVKDVFQNNKDAKLISFAIRPPEFYIVNQANSFGIKSYVVQHGIFIPFMKREWNYFFMEARKMFYYFKSIFALSHTNKEIGAFHLFKELYRIYIAGNKRISESIFREFDILPQRAFVYSNYWADYFKENYGFKKEQFSLVGMPDLEGFNEIISNTKEEAVCYICQTLVEDGRLAKKEFISFISVLSGLLDASVKVYIKLHPRTDIKLYKELTKRKKTVIIKDKLPNCTKYIGHYSTLLSLPLNITGNVFLWSFQGHVIPNYFKETARIESGEKEDLEAFLNLREACPPEKDILEYYFNKPGLKPFEQIALLINE
ncbi:MAG: alpha-2,8-polysialyltransferase family protein [Flavobacteriaceae bacterium]|nr:alpha-2,8-polysialyltransferase family protein [Flavobacteriaceae bacterium]